jgi:hypothetical protein
VVMEACSGAHAWGAGSRPWVWMPG